MDASVVPDLTRRIVSPILSWRIWDSECFTNTPPRFGQVGLMGRRWFNNGTGNRTSDHQRNAPWHPVRVLSRCGAERLAEGAHPENLDLEDDSPAPRVARVVVDVAVFSILMAKNHRALSGRQLTGCRALIPQVALSAPCPSSSRSRFATSLPENNQRCLAFCPGHLWVPPLFPCAGSNQRCAIFCGNSFPASLGTREWHQWRIVRPGTGANHQRRLRV